MSAFRDEALQILQQHELYHGRMSKGMTTLEAITALEALHKREVERRVEDERAHIAALFLTEAGGKVVLSLQTLQSAPMNPDIHRELMPNGSIEYWLDERAKLNTEEK